MKDADAGSPHDPLFRATFTHLDALRDFLANYLPPDVSELLDLDRLAVEPGTFVDPVLRDHFSDVLVQVGLRSGGEASIYVLFEHKSTPDAMTPLQVLRYIVLKWNDDLRNQRPLKPIVPVVVYHGKEPWNVAPGLRGLISAPPELVRLVPDTAYELCDLGQVPDEVLLGSESPELAVAGITLKHVFRTLRDVLTAQMRGRLSEAAVKPGGYDFLAQMVTYWAKAPGVTETEVSSMLRDVPGGEQIMATIADTWLAEGQAKGKAEGKAEGRIETQRGLCLEMLRRYHPQLLPEAEPKVNTCEDADRMSEWILTGPTISDSELRASILG